MKLLPCPFCGGEVETLTAESMNGGYLFGIMCNDCRSRGDVYDTEAEAIAAWNSRAAMEFDNWFYLPKPKERIVDYGEPEIARTENGYKVRQIADVVDEAARKWGEELGEYVMRRICEIWSSRAERTCHVNELDALTQTLSMANNCSWGECSECGCLTPTDSVFCVECGARVVE